MGEVYRASDPRLGREVAIKVLPASLTGDADRLRRFEQEAKATAALNHPNVLAVYDVGAHDGVAYLVSELLAGQSLREALVGGSLPLSKAVGWAQQAARGLAAAHDKGIVHRDLKPGNLFITGDGYVKILDFGLAKLTGADQLGDGETMIQGEEPETAAGSVLGTVGYMSPEQVRGEPADHRADIFAFGAILYEMLSGRRAFEAATGVETMNAILKLDPPELAASEALPPALVRIVEHCLDKDPAHRFQSARDLAFDLETVLQASSTSTGAPAAAAAGQRPKALWWIAGAAAIAVLAAVGWLARSSEAPPLGDELDPDRIAVLPFSVRGDEKLAYLREGLVDLLSTQLDGAGAIRTVDSHALLHLYEGDEQQEVIDPVAGAETARRFGAGSYVLGSLVTAGGLLQASASLYDAAGSELAEAQASGDSEDQVFAIVDELSRELLAGRFEDQPSRHESLGARTTESLEALKAYLAGEKEMRAGSWTLAIAELERAIEADPEFALAHYRLALATSWKNDDVQLAIHQANEAIRLGDRLATRDRTLLEALRAHLVGHADEGERLYRERIADYPDDVEAWYGLGEVLFHYNPARGRAKAEAIGPFRRAVELDPRHSAALLHLGQSLLLDEQWDEVPAMAKRFVELHPESESLPLAQAWAVHLEGSEEEREAYYREAVAAGPQTFVGVNYTLVNEFKDREAGRQLAELVAQSPFASPLLDYTAAFVYMAEGKYQKANEMWAGFMLMVNEASRPLLIAGQQPNPLFYFGHPYLELPREELAEARATLAAWTAPEELDYPGHAALGELLRNYVLGELAMRLDDSPAAVVQAQLLSDWQGAGDRELAAALAATLRGWIELRNGRLEQALAELEAAKLEASATLLDQSIYYSLDTARYLRAEALAGLGRYEEAIVWYRSLAEACCWFNLAWKPVTHLRRAEIYERLGEPERAAYHYDRMLAYWTDPDPQFLPVVERARESLARLRPGEERLPSSGLASSRQGC